LKNGKLTDEQRRALRILSRSPDGCTEALLLAHGFEIAMPGKLALDGFAKVEAHDTMAGSRRRKAVWLQITAAGRKAIHSPDRAPRRKACRRHVGLGFTWDRP
jgi:hypothetical protein